MEPRETSLSTDRSDRSCCLKEAVGPSPKLIQEPTTLSYLALSASHSWGSPLCSRDHGCSSLVVVLNLRQKSTGVAQQLRAPAPSSTQCPLPQDSLMAVGEVSPALGTPSLPRSLQFLLCLGALHTTGFRGKCCCLSVSVSALSLLPSFHCHVMGVAFPKPKLSPQLPFPDT